MRLQKYKKNADRITFFWWNGILFVILQLEKKANPIMETTADKVLDIIRTTVRSAEPDAEIILYGSRARGDARKDSDWDVVVLLNKPPMPHHERYKVAYDVWDKGQDIGEEINMLVYTKEQWDAAPPSLFKYNVREEGIRL